MKTIDTKSLVVGILAGLFLILLTSGRSPGEENELHLYSTGSLTFLFNKHTKTLYQYEGSGMHWKIDKKPVRIYKIAEDGSSILHME